MNFIFGRAKKNSQPKKPSLTVQDAVKMMKSKQAILIDVREAGEVSSTGKAKGAIHIPLFLLGQKADPRHPEFNKKLDQTKPIFIYCASGARSGMACRTMAKHGFDNVHNIGGFGHWKNAGGACER